MTHKLRWINGEYMIGELRVVIKFAKFSQGFAVIPKYSVCMVMAQVGTRSEF